MHQLVFEVRHVGIFNGSLVYPLYEFSQVASC